MEVDVKAELAKAQGELQALLFQVQQIDQQMQELNNRKTVLVQGVLEKQGVIKLLQQLDGKTPSN